MGLSVPSVQYLRTYFQLSFRSLVTAHQGRIPGALWRGLWGSWCCLSPRPGEELVTIEVGRLAARARAQVVESCSIYRG
jgi:hypothetical protein